MRGYTKERLSAIKNIGIGNDLLQIRNCVKTKCANIYNGPTNALVCIKTPIQMSHTKTPKITPTCFDHQMVIIRELFDPG
jgi:hypothetical protein